MGVECGRCFMLVVVVLLAQAHCVWLLVGALATASSAFLCDRDRPSPKSQAHARERNDVGRDF